MSNLKSRIAARVEQRKLAKLKKAAQNRVAAAWTIAKTMLPSAPTGVQEKFASSLLDNSEQVLASALKQTAINAHYTKIAETFESVHKMDINDMLENESVLATLKKEVEKELKGKAVKAKSKKAEDGEEKMDDEAPKDEMTPEGADDMPPAEDMTPEGVEDMGSSADAVPPVGDTISDEQKLDLHTDIEHAEDDIENIEHEIMDGSSYDLDIAAAFSDETKEAKKMSLANEDNETDVRESQYDVDIAFGDEHEADPEMDHEEQEMDGFFGPSGIEAIEASIDTDGMDVAGITDAAEFFTSGKAASNEPDQMGMLMSRKASDEIVKPGQIADHFETDYSDDRDAESDNEDSIFSEVFGKLPQDEFQDGLDRKDVEPEMMKVAGKKPSKEVPMPKVKGKGVKTLGDVSGKAPKTASVDTYYGTEAQRSIASLLFEEDSI